LPFQAGRGDADPAAAEQGSHAFPVFQSGEFPAQFVFIGALHLGGFGLGVDGDDPFIIPEDDPAVVSGDQIGGHHGDLAPSARGVHDEGRDAETSGVASQVLVDASTEDLPESPRVPFA